MHWIWLSPTLEPDAQCAQGLAHPLPEGQRGFIVAQFRKTVSLPAGAVSARFLASADTVYRLEANGRTIATGPAPIGGDWLPLPRCPHYFADEFSAGLSDATALELLATVRLGACRGTELSLGHGGFALRAEILLADGSTFHLQTDASWEARRLPAWSNHNYFDGTVAPSPWHAAAEVEDRWHAVPAPIPMRTETRLAPDAGGPVTAAPGTDSETLLEWRRIHCATLVVAADGPCRIEAEIWEDRPKNFFAKHHFIFGEGGGTVRAIAPHSVGGIRLRVHADSPDRAVTAHASIAAQHYPVAEEGSFACSDPGLSNVYDVCRWTLRICRQAMHLDSPKHQEPLACTGDYYIETLMTAACFGDMRLAAFDVRRTAGMLDVADGRLFHTSYSLIWVRMLLDVYRFTGDRSLLEDCLPALGKLLDRFRGYRGENGLVENPPDYMFVDWTVFEGYDMHHPPKCLGQTVLNAFFHGALLAAADIYRTTGREAEARAAETDASTLRTAVRSLLWDPERRLFFDGLNTPERNPGQWLPDNPPSLRHFSLHANALAVLFGIVDGEDGTDLLRRALDAGLPDAQPYFMHFVLEAIAKCGLFAEYGMRILRRWIPLVETCDKGLQEGWFAPVEGYGFDYSHAWGGTPAYQLPVRLLGLRLLEPGWKAISLSPNLHGLEWADIEIPTPFGRLRAHLRTGQEPAIQVPDGIRVIQPATRNP